MNRVKTLATGILLFSIALLAPLQSRAQNVPDDDQSITEFLRKLLENDALSFGMLLQTQAEVHWDPNIAGQNSFSVAAARFKIYGDLDDHFSYKLQADVKNAPAIKDASITYAANRFAITAGAQKPGISAEFLTSSSSTDFINRSRVVGALVQQRDIGLLAHLALSNSVVLSAGMFNGTNQKITNNNNTFYYTGRLVFVPDVGEENLVRIGLNAAHSEENGTQIGNGFLPAIYGERTIYGGDIRLESGRLMFSSEVLLANLEYGSNQEDDVVGYHITGGYWIANQAQLLLRLDHLQSDLIEMREDNLLLAGLNYNFTDVTSFQFNYKINPDDINFSNQYWMAQLQVAF